MNPVTDHDAAEAADTRLAILAEPLLAREGVDWGPIFSSTGLRVRGKVFGVVNHAGRLMVKIPEARADELIAEGAVERVVMRDRAMREWVEMPLERGERAWAALLEEAHHYLDEVTPR